ncbi:hypothetical protein [Pistricoccus aurantiacus]|uniref:Uncharacterized protein n=1 Tax=Pistricoccus aurantiacus TaxID=1883414 RepID=A0A5B8SPW9_9GAMM|nr:hypothetical protein [Pistricoccus aurantiacus]QEA38766.1 hypothetical protein FGL86_06525 [Pistricoccus aurantiacus]
MKKHFELEKPPASLPYPLVGAIALMLGMLALGNHLGWRPGMAMLLGAAVFLLLYGATVVFAGVRRGASANAESAMCKPDG